MKSALALPVFIPLDHAESRFSTHFVCYVQLLLSRFFHKKSKTKTLPLVYKSRPLGFHWRNLPMAKKKGRVRPALPLFIPQQLGGQLVKHHSAIQKKPRSKHYLSLFFSHLSLRWRLTTAWCQIYHLSNGFLICLGYHLPDILPPPPLPYLKVSPHLSSL